MSLTFPHRERFVDPYEGLSFVALADGNERVQCHVTIEALHDHFGLDQGATGQILSLFDDNRASIEAVATRKYDFGEIVPGRGIVLGSDDFR